MESFERCLVNTDIWCSWSTPEFVSFLYSSGPYFWCRPNSKLWPASAPVCQFSHCWTPVRFTSVRIQEEDPAHTEGQITVIVMTWSEEREIAKVFGFFFILVFYSARVCSEITKYIFPKDFRTTTVVNITLWKQNQDVWSTEVKFLCHAETLLNCLCCFWGVTPPPTSM